jgi:hypothetical protein
MAELRPVLLGFLVLMLAAPPALGAAPALPESGEAQLERSEAERRVDLDPTAHARPHRLGAPSHVARSCAGEATGRLRSDAARRHASPRSPPARP